MLVNLKRKKSITLYNAIGYKRLALLGNFMDFTQRGARGKDFWRYDK